MLVLLAFTLPLTEGLKNLALISFILIGLYSTYKKEIVIQFDLLNKLAISIPLTIIIGAYFTIDSINSIKHMSSILTMSILFIYIRELQLSQKRINILLVSLFIGFLITLAWGYNDFIYNGKNFLELHSVGHVNHSSIYMLLIFIISFVYLSLNFKELTISLKIFISIVILASLISIFVSGSRATMYTSIGILVLYAIYSGYKLQNKYIIFGIVTLLICIYLLFIGDVNTRMSQKFAQGFEDSARINLIYSSYYTWINNNIFFGIGLGNGALIDLHDYYPQSIYTILTHSHNTFLTYLVERGLVGLMAYISFIFVLFYILVQKLRQNNNSFILICAILLWIMNFIISFANTTFHHENAILMLIIWAIAVGSLRKNNAISNTSK
jgi:O-antigen ligase